MTTFIYYNLPGMEAKQGYMFGTINSEDLLPDQVGEDEIQIVEDCYEHFAVLASDSETFFADLDEETWLLIRSWRQHFSGLQSKSCMVAGFINGTKSDIQIKNTVLHEGGSPCCSIPSQDFDELNNILKPGTAVVFFAWQRPPSYEQGHLISMEVETNSFVCTLMNKKDAETKVETIAGHNVECIFLERSISTWWSKFWVVACEKQ